MGSPHFARRQRIQRLVRLLHNTQKSDNLTTSDMASRLGISISMLSMVYSGQRNPGHKFIRGILRAYPQLYDEVWEFIVQESPQSRRYATQR